MQDTVRHNHSLIFILGGARSGKSDYALELARQMAGEESVLFIATAQAGDDEMAERIAYHKSERPNHWQTLEAPLNVGSVWRTMDHAEGARPRVAIVDCVTLLVSNVLFADGSEPELSDESRLTARLMMELDDLIAAAYERSCSLILVSNEVGLGIVPVGRINRLYRDLIGRANRRLATAADQAIFLIAGVPLDLGRLQCLEIER